MGGAGVVTRGLFPEKRKRQYPEGDLQKGVCLELKWRLPHNAAFHSVPNGAMRGRRTREILVSQGMRAGAPDLIVYWEGRVFLFELKSEQGHASWVQKQFHDKLKVCRHPVHICRTAGEVMAVLTDAGVPLLGTVG